MTQKNEMQETTRIDSLFEKVSALIEQGRQRVVSAVNIAEVYTKYCIGQYIVEDEQQGKDRAEYGKQVLKELSARLTERFGDGWSYPSMKNIRQFYLTYSKRLNTVYPIDTEKAKQRLANSGPGNDIAKTDRLSHQDLGQMQMYVNYYDRFVKQDYEKPTIGILLCESKKDALVELTLPKDANIYATQYQLYLPDKEVLQAKVKEWIAEFDEANDNA